MPFAIATPSTPSTHSPLNHCLLASYTYHLSAYLPSLMRKKIRESPGAGTRLSLQSSSAQAWRPAFTPSGLQKKPSAAECTHPPSIGQVDTEFWGLAGLPVWQNWHQWETLSQIKLKSDWRVHSVLTSGLHAHRSACAHASVCVCAHTHH